MKPFMLQKHEEASETMRELMVTEIDEVSGGDGFLTATLIFDPNTNTIIQVIPADFYDAEGSSSSTTEA